MLFTLSPSRRTVGLTKWWRKVDRMRRGVGLTRRRCARRRRRGEEEEGGGGGGGGRGKKGRKEGRKEGIRVVGQSGPATSSSCPGLEEGGGGGRNARRLMAGVETSVTSVDKTECPECYLAAPRTIRTNQTETHFRAPPSLPFSSTNSFPRTKIYGISTATSTTRLSYILFFFFFIFDSID